MASGFAQWEADPLFSAAEVVQDSADRMESFFRILLHDQSLLQSEPADQKLLNSIDHHRRDLATALGTTKWQLEDFERAVSLAASSDSSRLTADAIFRHKQFIRAIREQIVNIERGLEGPSKGAPERNTQWINLNENDRDGLALFLTGGNPVDYLAQHHSSSGIMNKFLDSTKVSNPADKNDEIIELETAEIEDPQVNGVMHLNNGFDNLKANKLRNAGSNYFTQSNSETLVLMKESPGNDEDGSWDLEKSDSNGKRVFSKNKLKGSWNRLDVLGFWFNLRFPYGSKMSRSFLKRTKDGEVSTDLDQKPSSSYIGLLPVEQGRYDISRGLCSDVFKTMLSSRMLAVCRKAYQRLRYNIQSNQFPLQIAASIFLTLIILGGGQIKVAFMNFFELGSGFFHEGLISHYRGGSAPATFGRLKPAATPKTDILG